MYRKFRDDPSSVDQSWHEFLVDYNPDPAVESPSQVKTPPPAVAPPPPVPAVSGNGSSTVPSSKPAPTQPAETNHANFLTFGDSPVAQR